jgi:probable ATP-dependent RNA helicase DDX4
LFSEGEYQMKTLVFVERKRTADYVALNLSSASFKATSIHGDRYQFQREEALEQFRRGECPVLIATEVAARGLDIRGVDHVCRARSDYMVSDCCFQVINYDLPQNIDSYVHRIGRTGRVGNVGRATSFYDPNLDRPMASALVAMLAKSQMPVPQWLRDEAEKPCVQPTYRR